MPCSFFCVFVNNSLLLRGFYLKLCKKTRFGNDLLKNCLYKAEKMCYNHTVSLYKGVLCSDLRQLC